MAFYRRPSPLELTYLAADTPTYSPYVNQFFAEGVGDLDLQSLAKAVETVAAVMIEIRMKLKGHWRWRYWDSAGPLPHVYSVNAANWDGLSNEGAPIIGAPMNVRSGPVCEIVLLEGNPKRVLFRTHHACTDGAGTLFLMNQVFKVLRGEVPDAPNSCSTEWDVAQQEGPCEKKTPLGSCKPIFRNTQIPPIQGCIWKRVLYKGNASGITGKVMSVLASIASPAEDERLVFRIPADLRRYLPKGQFTASNCSSALDIEIGEDRTPRRLQQAIVTAMRTKQDIALIHPNARFLHWFPLRYLATPEKYRRKAYQENQFPYSCVITNVGVVPLESLSCAQFKCTGAYGVNIPLPLASLSVSFSLCKEGVWISIGIPRAIGTSTDLDKISADIIMKLELLEQHASTKKAK